MELRKLDEATIRAIEFFLLRTLKEDPEPYGLRVLAENAITLFNQHLQTRELKTTDALGKS